MIRFPPERIKRNRRRLMLGLVGLLLFASIFFLCLSISFIHEDPKTRITIIGKTLKGRALTAQRFGEDGPVRIVVVCGLHGIYESGSIALGKFIMNRFDKKLPIVTVSLLANMNPDSGTSPLEMGSWAQRFNGNDIVVDPKGRKVGVDLNRNWGTKSWKRDVEYAAGSPLKNAGGKRPFSEPETRALRDFLLALRRSGKRVFVLSFHNRVGNAARGGTVEPSLSPLGIPVGASGEAAKAYARAMAYKVAHEWTDYPVTGDFMTWLGENAFEGFEAEMSGDERDAAIENADVLAAFLPKLSSFLSSIRFTRESCACPL